MNFTEFLIENDALKFGSFKLKSGRTCPYFVNFGAIHSGSSSYLMGKFFAEKIKELGGIDIVYGPAYKGIPLAVSTSIALEKEFNIQNYWLFDRKEAKEHGDKGNFVGRIPSSSDNVVLIDDVFTTGGTKRNAIEKIEALGGKVLYLLIGVDRQEKGKEVSAVKEFYESTGIQIYSVISISEIFTYLKNNNKIDDIMYNNFVEYMDEYGLGSR